MYLLERGPKDLGELNTLAQKYLIAHKQQLGDKSKATVQPRRADQKKSTEIDSPNQIRHKDARGHCSDTTVKVLDTGNYSVVQRLVPARIRVSQSSQKKTHAMVAQLDEDGEKACTCVEVKETRSKRNLKKSGTKGSTNSDRAVYSAVCRAQSNDGETYVGVG